MSDRPKFLRAQALVVASQTIACLKSSCKRIEIAGSLRRVTDRRTWMSLITTSEREVFELCGVPFLEPCNR